jgi:hypothetical protein
MKLLNDDLINEFYKTIEDSKITIEQAKDICYGPWRFLKEEMENGELCEIRFKYFGTFQVYPGRAKNMLQNLKQKVNNISTKEYSRIENILTNFLNKNGKNNF